MARNKGGFFVIDTLGASLVLGQESVTDNALEAFQEASEMVLQHAKSYAPWADRTGMAREGLGVEVYEEGGDIYLDLFHTVDYGEWLETIQNGAFATIMPTLELYAEAIFEQAGAGITSIQEGDA